MVEMNRPKVSVLVLTYNHEQYIEEALRSVLKQVTSHSYEIVVAEDCSTDRTLAKVQAIAKENPSLFRILHRSKNQGLCRNFADAYGRCQGEYVSILEGDDFWHHPHKLQRHVDVLDKNKKCCFVFNDVCMLSEDGQLTNSLYPPYVRSKLRLRDFLADNFINCSSLTFRHRLIPCFPKWFLSLKFYDWALHILHLQHGHALYLREALSTYRIHRAAAWQGCPEQQRLHGIIEIFDSLNEHLGYRYESIFRLNKKYWRVIEELCRVRVEYFKLKEELNEQLRSQKLFQSSRAYRITRLLSHFKNGICGLQPRRAA